MDKKQLADLLESEHKMLFDWLDNQPNENWDLSLSGKWSMGQHINHLVNSLQLLNNALSYPKFILKYKFGTCNRPTRDYNTVAQNYEKKLKANQDKVREFNRDVKKPTLLEKDRLLTRFQIQQKKLQYKTLRISDKNLDTLVLPHPLMGKLTIREMIMWTIHHTKHHLKTLQKHY